jgi:hypothetical protein
MYIDDRLDWLYRAIHDLVTLGVHIQVYCQPARFNSQRLQTYNRSTGRNTFSVNGKNGEVLRHIANTSTGPKIFSLVDESTDAVHNINHPDFNSQDLYVWGQMGDLVYQQNAKNFSHSATSHFGCCNVCNR